MNQPKQKRENEFAMTFEDIGNALGVSTDVAYHTYLVALRKLRRSLQFRKAWVRELYTPEPEAPGYVSRHVLGAQMISLLPLRNFPVIPKRRHRQ